MIDNFYTDCHPIERGQITIDKSTMIKHGSHSDSL